MIFELNPKKWLNRTPETKAPKHTSEKINTRKDAEAIGPLLAVIPAAHLDRLFPVPNLVARTDVSVVEAPLQEPAEDRAPAVFSQPQENTMATAPVVPHVIPHGFSSFMQHLLKDITLGLEDVIKYAPPAARLAETLFPEYALAEQSSQLIAVQIATLLLKAIISSQQKYASLPLSPETNAAKLADVLSTVAPIVLLLLERAGFAADSNRVRYAIEAIVSILKAYPSPIA